MGGEIDWTALPLLADLYGVSDLQRLVKHLTAIRDHFRRQQGAM